MFSFSFGFNLNCAIDDNFLMRGTSSDHDWPSFLFLRTCLWHTYHKSFFFSSANVAIQFPWITKMFQNNENSLQLPFSKDLIFVLTIFFVLLNPANQGQEMFLFLHLQRLSFYTLHKWFLMCVYFQMKMSINKSFAKAKEKLEQAKHNSQID